MGFGSYDESEQEDASDNEIDTEDAVNVHENDHQGEVSFESDASSEELVDRLQEIKD